MQAKNMIDIDYETASNFESVKYRGGDMKILPSMIDVRSDITQVFVNSEDDDRYTIHSGHPNPKKLSSCLPKSVARTLNRRGNKDIDISIDPLKKFNLPSSHKAASTLRKFMDIIDGSTWSWQSDIRPNRDDGDILVHPSRYQFTIDGSIHVGDNVVQRIAPAVVWKDYWNDWMTMLPFIIPFFTDGNTCYRYNRKAFLHRLIEDDIVKIFNGEHGNDITMSSSDPLRFVSKFSEIDIYSPFKTKENIFYIEMNVSNAIPNVSMPAIYLMNMFFRKTLIRGKSIDLVDHAIVHDFWNQYKNNDVYDALLNMENVEFVPGNNLPYVLRENQLKVFETGLDLFRAICRRFIGTSPIQEGLHFDKIMRLFSDFVDFSRVPSHLIWDIDELYRLVYEDKNKIEYQEEYLRYGSKVIIPVENRVRKDNNIKKLLSGR